MTDPLRKKVEGEFDRLAGDLGPIGIAFSGGGDSSALLHLAAGWRQGRRVLAATVDHGLRPESAREAAAAGAVSRAAGIPHSILRWHRGEGERANLMAAARDARLRLLSAWARAEGLSAVLLGHTLDDQAETFLMRLARGAGVDGLAAMADRRDSSGMVWLRPLLGCGRQELRDWLAGQGLGWVDDPSNENTDFERVRMRKALDLLQITPESFAVSARNLASARAALQQVAMQTAAGAEAALGSLSLPIGPFLQAPFEIRRRLLVAALRWMNGQDYPARRDKIAHALDAVGLGRKITLEGVMIWPEAQHLRLIREPAAAARAAAAPLDAEGCAEWDDRWRVCIGMAAGQGDGAELPASLAGAELRALGHEALAALDWRGAGLRHDEAAALPALWQGQRLIAAPIAAKGAPTRADGGPPLRFTPLRGLSHLRGLLFSH